MNYPKNLLYSTAHIWVKAGDNVATVGITEDIQDEFDELASIDLPMVGDELEIDANCVTIHHGDELLHVASPLSGRVLEVNAPMGIQPELIFASPYDNGWLFKMEFDEPEELELLMDSEEYTYEHDL